MRFSPDPSTRRPDPEPTQTNLVRIVLVGMGVWVVLLAAALLARETLHDDGRGWWVLVPVWGIGLGLLGLPWARRNSRDDPAHTGDPITGQAGRGPEHA